MNFKFLLALLGAGIFLFGCSSTPASKEAVYIQNSEFTEPSAMKIAEGFKKVLTVRGYKEINFDAGRSVLKANVPDSDAFKNMWATVRGSTPMQKKRGRRLELVAHLFCTKEPAKCQAHFFHQLVEPNYFGGETGYIISDLSENKKMHLALQELFPPFQASTTTSDSNSSKSDKPKSTDSKPE